MALDPLAAIEQAAQFAQLSVNANTADILHRVRGAHHVRDRTNAADARGDIDGFGEMSAAQQRFEKTRRFENSQFDAADIFAIERDMQRGFALDAGDVIDVDRSSRQRSPALSL